jgi:hypothetical protein
MKKDIDKGKHHKREKERMWGNEKERKKMMANNVKNEHNDMWNFCSNLWFCKIRIVDLKC